MLACQSSRPCCSSSEDLSKEWETVLLVLPEVVESALKALKSAGCIPQPWHQGGRFGARVRPFGVRGDRAALRGIPVLADAGERIARYLGTVANGAECDDLPAPLRAVLRGDGVQVLYLPVVQAFWRLPTKMKDKSVHATRASETLLLPQPPKGSFTFIELFAGIGGFRIGLEAIGGECVFSSEIQEFAVAMYEQNFGSLPPMTGDVCGVSDESIPPHDLLVGGFPCQPFSSLGLQPGMGDNRGLLFKQIVRILTLRRPRAFLLENVPGILTCDEGRALESIINALRDAGYSVSKEQVNASCLTAQSRSRVYFVGLRQDMCDTFAEKGGFEFPFIPDLQLRAGDILEPDAELVASGSAKQCSLDDNLFARRRQAKSWINGGAGKLAWDDKVCDTLVSHYGSGIIEGNSQLVPRLPPHNPRLFSPRECARLMGFPNEFQLEGGSLDAQFVNMNKKCYRKLGNAVCPPIVAAIAGSILACCADLPGYCVVPDWVATGRSAAVRLALSALPLKKRLVVLQRLHESWCKCLDH